MKRIKVIGFALAAILAVCSCGSSEGDRARKTDADPGYASSSASDINPAEEEKKNKFAGPWITYVTPEDKNDNGNTGDDSEYPGSKKSGITWYVNEDCTVMKYEGELAEKFIDEYYDGKSADLRLEMAAPSGTLEVRRHVEGGHLEFIYGTEGKGGGMCCDGFEESMFRDYGCNCDLEVCGYIEDGAIYICVYHNGIDVGPDEFPHVSIYYMDEDDVTGDYLYDECGKKSQQYSTDVPDRFLQNVGTAPNLYSLSDFPFADISKAKTSDYELNMAHENGIELISFNEAGKVVGDIFFARNPETGEITESEGSYYSKYNEFECYKRSGSIMAYPHYFSKPYLTPHQFTYMDDN